MRNCCVLLFDRAVFCVDAGTRLREGARKYSYKLIRHVLAQFRAQELRVSGGGRPGLPSLISLIVSVDVKQHLKKEIAEIRAQELCESGGGRHGFPDPNSNSP